MYEYRAVHNFHLKRWDLFLEWRWGCSIFRSILVTVPGTSDAAIENTTFAQWSILMLTNVRDHRHFTVVLEDSDTLARKRNYFGTLLRNRFCFAYFDKTLDNAALRFGLARVDSSFLPAGDDMQAQDRSHPDSQCRGQDRASLRL